MDQQTRRMTKTHVLMAIGYVIAAALLSVGLGFAITLAEFGRDNPSPAAGIAWIILSSLLFLAFAFFGLIYLIEFLHTRARGGRKVLWRNFALRLLLSLTGLIGPFWMLDVHPTLARRPALLEAINVLFAALSILLLLWAFAIRLPIPASETEAAGDGSSPTSVDRDRPGN